MCNMHCLAALPPPKKLNCLWWWWWRCALKPHSYLFFYVSLCWLLRLLKTGSPDNLLCSPLGFVARRRPDGVINQYFLQHNTLFDCYLVPESRASIRLGWSSWEGRLLFVQVLQNIRVFCFLGVVFLFFWGQDALYYFFSFHCCETQNKKGRKKTACMTLGGL